MLLLFYALMYQRSVDVPFRLFINWLSRLHEYQADEYAIQNEYGEAIYCSLVRNYAANLDIIFESPYLNFIKGSHPTFLDRLAAIQAKLGENVEVKIPKVEIDEDTEEKSNDRPEDKDKKGSDLQLKSMYQEEQEKAKSEVAAFNQVADAKQTVHEETKAECSPIKEVHY